ncbi:MAG TPA: FKBP-type peptidyl-prolyl cis-trans isomerase [Chitinophagales bacterium]|nr:FKBP-type peptidyl-prolyl cis-trans isomerase [Chitinophagales bacterium]HNL85117.1 FKBP-type peptidyl-prolyl cis-trans isomerase [Chitinophagales bacterium]
MKHYYLFLLSFVCLSTASFAQKTTTVKPKTTKAPTKPVTVKPPINPFKTKFDSISYFIGIQIGNDMKNNGATELQPSQISKGIKDAMSGTKPQLDMQATMMLAQNYFMQKQQEKAMMKMLQNQQFFAQNATRPGVKTTASGLQYEILKDTAGPKPLATDMVKVHYHGTFLDGKVFDSSVERGQPAQFPLNGVIPGWTEGLQLMSVGSKYRLYVPAKLAYGEQGMPEGGIGPNEPLIFDVQLLDIVKQQPQQQPDIQVVPQTPTNLPSGGQ